MEVPRTMTQNQSRKKTAYVETYGCQMNISDGELMQGILAAAGYEIVARPEAADVVLVNTCAIREHAEQRVIGRVGELYRLKSVRPDVVIGVTGCMAQRLGTRLLEKAAYVDLVMGPDGYRELPQVLGKLRPSSVTASPATVGVTTSRRRDLPVFAAISAAVASATANDDRLAVLDFRGDENYEGLEVRRTSGISAWVPVQRGCNHR